jgi:CHASE2 domain-containing sensor protein
MVTRSSPAPSHLVPLALVLLIWHGVLVADYVIERFDLGQPNWPALMAALPLDTLWLKVAWALGTWLGFGAAFFLMLRDNASVLLFFAAAVAFGATAIGTYAIPAAGVALPLAPILAALVLVPALGWIYARTLNRRGVLH